MSPRRPALVIAAGWAVWASPTWAQVPLAPATEIAPPIQSSIVTPAPYLPTPAISAPGTCPRCGQVHRRRWPTCKAKHQALWLGYPDKFQEPPLGAFVYAAAGGMVRKGEAARMVLYDYDFLPGTSRLSPRGRDQLARLGASLATTPYPLIVEATPTTPGLDQERRLSVLAELARGPMPVPSERVAVAAPMSRGLSGVEAVLVHQNQLGWMVQGGPPLNVNILRATPLGPSGATGGAGPGMGGTTP